ncbi:hypothetical protein BGZ49_001060, partial [Haplosporangium sp. Z 27]
FCHLVEQETEEEEVIEEETEMCQEPNITTQIQVLKRSPGTHTPSMSTCENTCGTSSNNDSAFSRPARTLSIEEREKNYAEARARIFQDDNHANHHESESVEEAISTATTSTTTKPDVEETFEPLSDSQKDDCPGFGEASHMPQHYNNNNNVRGRRLARSPSTSSTASSSSGTNMTDISSRSDFAMSGEFHSPGSPSGYLCSSSSSSSSSSSYHGGGSGRSTGHSSTPMGYDCHGRHNYQRSSGSMTGNTGKQRHSYHSDNHHQPHLQQFRHHYDPCHSYGSPVHYDSRYFHCNPTTSCSSPSDGYNATYFSCPQNNYTHVNNTHNNGRPYSYPHNGHHSNSHHQGHYSSQQQQHSQFQQTHKRFSGAHYQGYQQHSGYSPQQHHSPSWSNMAPRYGHLSPHHQNNVAAYDYQRAQDSPPPPSSRCCDSYRCEGGLYPQQGLDQESQEQYQEDRQGRLDFEKYGGGRVTADAMAVGPSPRLFQVPARPYPTSTGYRPYRQGVTLLQQPTRHHQQHQHHRRQPQYHQQQQHQQHQQQGSTQLPPIPIPVTRRQGSGYEPSRESWRTKSGREGVQVVYDVDSRPPKSSELYDPYAPTGNSDSSSSTRGRNSSKDLTK